jgi:hypothetical protein
MVILIISSLPSSWRNSFTRSNRALRDLVVLAVGLFLLCCLPIWPARAIMTLLAGRTAQQTALVTALGVVAFKSMASTAITHQTSLIPILLFPSSSRTYCLDRYLGAGHRPCPGQSFFLPRLITLFIQNFRTRQLRHVFHWFRQPDFRWPPSSQGPCRFQYTGRS